MSHCANLTSAVLAAVSLTLVMPDQQASAATIFTGKSSGTFGTPTVDANDHPDAVFSIRNIQEKGETFTFGEASPGSMPNMVSFLGQPFSASAEKAFKVGNLSYFNGQTFIGTDVASVPLSLNLAFEQPVSAQQQFDYRFTFDLTPNNDETSNADNLVISNNPAPQPLTVDEARYRVELLGFSPDNGTTFSRSFQASEDEVVTSTLFAQLKLTSINRDIKELDDSTPTEIPEPASVSGLFILGAAILRRKSKFS